MASIPWMKLIGDREDVIKTVHDLIDEISVCSHSEQYDYQECEYITDGLFNGIIESPLDFIQSLKDNKLFVRAFADSLKTAWIEGYKASNRLLPITENPYDCE